MPENPELVATLQPTIDRLRALAAAIKAMWPSETLMVSQWGWNNPPVSSSDLAQMASDLAARIETIKPELIEKGFDNRSITERIETFQQSTLPQLFSGNGAQATAPYLALIAWIESKFQAKFPSQPDWEAVDADGRLPKSLSAKLRSYKASIERLGIDLESLESKVHYIEQAHEAALSLPTDLESLRSANDEVTKLRTSAEKDQIRTAAVLTEVESKLLLISEKEKEARKLVENTEDAYSAATTRGLGEAFQQRADSLAKSMWVWVVGLLIALVSGFLTGAYRISELQKLFNSGASSGLISLNLVLSLISVAAPVWFAWIATKQIGQRFRLSEDYAFKASVAKAYEGYRREAARVDPKFAARLFGSALDRIEEAPLRFVENETHGSPLHEFLGRGQRSSNTSGGRQAPAPAAIEKGAEAK